MPEARLILGDCIEKMRELEENSVDAVITDPPYGLEFMGKDWDGFDTNAKFQDFNRKWATEALRVLKPGGFMFAMGGTRTHHRLTCGIEDAGFLIRDELCWVYMQGFPKAQDLGVLISKREGAVREGAGSSNTKSLGEYASEYQEMNITENGKQWQGWKTPALKPAFEPIVVAQKPCKGGITENVMKHGVGGYNIDECRIPYENKKDSFSTSVGVKSYSNNRGLNDKYEKSLFSLGAEFERDISPSGRFPSNLLMQEECFGKLSKFFLVPKASKGEKNKNVEEVELKSTGHGNLRNSDDFERFDTYNNHPTVKPVALMQHLIKLTTKPGYTVLDPFLGSGTTAVATLNLNRKIIGIEINEEYMKIAQARIAEEVMQSRLF